MLAWGSTILDSTLSYPATVTSTPTLSYPATVASTPTLSYPSPVTSTPTISLPTQQHPADNQTVLPVSTTIIIIITVIPSTLLMLVCTVVVIILIVRWRINRKQVQAAHEHLEMSTSEAYITRTAEIATTKRVTYMTHGILSSLTPNRM